MANIMITSGTSFEGYEITEYGPYKFVQTILSSNFLKEIGASIADIATDRSSMYPVSYTHLDVYKRQVLNEARMVS